MLSSIFSVSKSRATSTQPVFTLLIIPEHIWSFSNNDELLVNTPTISPVKEKKVNLIIQYKKQNIIPELRLVEGNSFPGILLLNVMIDLPYKPELRFSRDRLIRQTPFSCNCLDETVSCSLRFSAISASFSNSSKFNCFRTNSPTLSKSISAILVISRSEIAVELVYIFRNYLPAIYHFLTKLLGDSKWCSEEKTPHSKFLDQWWTIFVWDE